MSADDGEITALLGCNGAGQTSTLRCISGMTPPAVRSGRIRFDETDITEYSPENIAVKGVSTAEIHEYLPGLDERRSQKAGISFGGEQQMLTIVRALRQSTDLSMVDEPYERFGPANHRGRRECYLTHQ